ncbi:hypothetical protein VB711_14590 [Cronbergia sp. UHCC 0137]|uniref:hypothetical protein n=1 Tax=Cronbergia sp. UHCC 0137 TaxID=3110239 RepID=UPI002B214F7E|nr:hypothetical protein [Cronbergia sp. UHCC 0137]MEA5619056.1 hypothetical protein [Cronbergia sp. UHCC 0137]
MIEGRFGENGQIYFEIDLIGGDNFSFPVETMLDTGFTEHLAMNKQDIQGLDWSFLSQDKLRTAQGETELIICVYPRLSAFNNLSESGCPGFEDFQDFG